MTEAEVATLQEFSRLAEQNLRDIWAVVRELQDLGTKRMLIDERVKADLKVIHEKVDELRKDQLELGAADVIRNNEAEQLVIKVKNLETAKNVNAKWIAGIVAICTAFMSSIATYVLSHWNVR